MSKTVLNIKTDVSVKRQAQDLARELGVPLSTVVNAYLKEFIREKELRLSASPRLRPSVEKELKKLIDEADRGMHISPEFSSAEEAIAYLESEGI
jgi:addiction module RelB/DinJ family antitoxin